ncbi:e3 ubiquitin-protein ligase RNF13 [Trichonephila clavipes]|nr:e3 ubiquitin-protein ligase RNF13 [Trichonephila clavipes]
MWLQDVMDIPLGCHGAKDKFYRIPCIVGTVHHTIPPHTITPAVGAVCRCKAKTGLRRSPRGLHIRIRLSSLLRLNLDSRVAKGELVPFLVRGSTPNGDADGCMSRAAHVMGAVIPNSLPPGAFVWFEKTHGSLMKVLLVPEWRPMKQLAVRMHLLQCSGLLDDWPVDGVLSLIHWSQHPLTTKSKRPN